MAYNITIDQVLNNQIAVTTTAFPITISYNATVFDAGPAGADGQGVAVGGAAGQVLAKIDTTDYNTQWVDKQDPTVVNDSQPNILSTGQHWYRPVTGAFYTARDGAWDPINDDGFF